MNLKLILAGTGLICCNSAAVAQKSDFASVLANKDIPFTLKLKDLSPDWRRMKFVGATMTGSGLEGLTGMMGNLGPLMQLGMMSEMGKGAAKNNGMDAMMPAVMSMLGGMFGGGGDPVYYTKGQTVELGSETFIITYRHKKPTMDLMQMMMGAAKPGGENNAPDPKKIVDDGKLKAESELALNLLNSKAIGQINDLRPFDMQKEIEEANASQGLMDMLAAEAGKPGVEDKAKPDVADAQEAPLDILDEIKQVIAKDATVGKLADNIEVRIENNVVILTGSVKTAQQKARITNLIQQKIKALGVNYTLRNSLSIK